MLRLTIFLALVCLAAPVLAQGVDCTINVNYDAVASSNKDLLVNLASDIRDYVNNYQWGADNIPDRVKCTLDIFVQGVSGTDRYTAQVFIGSQRPVFKSNKNTAVVRLKDDNWEFTYIKGRPLSHNIYTFGDLTSFLDYYMSIIVGFDSDTYDPNGGNPWFSRAMEIASMGGNAGAKGWSPSGSTFTRIDFIQEILLAGAQPLRTANYVYHYGGLDSMAISPARAQDAVIRAINLVAQAKNSIGPRSWVAKLFFETKYMEIAEILQTYPDKSIYKRLAQLDPSHTKTYDEYSLK
jgi:hypothetical protein